MLSLCNHTSLLMKFLTLKSFLYIIYLYIVLHKNITSMWKVKAVAFSIMHTIFCHNLVKMTNYKRRITKSEQILKLTLSGFQVNLWGLSCEVYHKVNFMRKGAQCENNYPTERADWAFSELSKRSHVQANYATLFFFFSFSPVAWLKSPPDFHVSVTILGLSRWLSW